MTLAENIAALRTEKKLSQGALAEQVGVSRQSVSKWETGASTPDLEKLMLLADFFGVTLDALVKDSTPAPSVVENESPEPIPVEVTAVSYAEPRKGATQQRIAACLLILGGIAAIAGFALLPPLLFLAVYLLLCSLICFAVKRYAELVIGWGTFLGLVVLSPYLFGSPVFVWIGLAGLAVTALRTAWVIYKAVGQTK